MAAAERTALIALASAASWGGGDFCGGMGAKTATPGLAGTIRFVMLAQAVSLVVLTAVLFAQHAAWPHGAPLFWALAAGMCGGLGLVTFYKALSRGGMGVPAAISGLLAAAIPAAVSSVLEGVPGTLRLMGFAVAAVAIWLVAAGDSPESVGGVSAQARGTMALTLFSGAAFGLYFVGLKLANPLGDLMPTAIARASGLALLAVMLVALRLRGRRGNPADSGGSRNWLVGWPWALAVALLDTGGNILFVAATRAGRLDVASVLASLYPAVTILLAAWQLHERPTRRQVAGMATAIAAVVMITL